MKICKKCGIEKAYSQFKKDKRNPGGAGSPCLECYSVYLKSDIQKHQSYLRVQKWFQKNKESLKGNQKRLESFKKYHRNHKEKISKYNREYIQKNREKIRELSRRYPERLKARELTRQAIRSGRLVRPKICSICDAERKIQAHHVDYSKPLEIMWLCVDCHKKQHLKYQEEKYESVSSF
jgi:glutamate synthase domain-containing protein 2